MHKRFCCRRGHHWEVSLDSPVAVAVECIVCPACGAPAETVAPPESVPAVDPNASTDLATAGAPAVLVGGDRVSVTGYEILAPLGQGGMGVVYRARHIELKRIVALKMLLPQSHVSIEQRERFRAEAEAAARLQHPHIVQIYEIGDQGGRPYIALEFVDGGGLDKKLAGMPQPARFACELLEPLARAMHVAHQRGVVHRDLKPANVLLTADGMPKITDFGLAKQFDVDAGQTRSGAILGTPSYMAPEQAEGRKEAIGPCSDVYGLGAILYEVVTGRPPFRGTTLLETLEQVRSRQPVPPRSLQPDLPRDLETICLKCLQKEPHRRYASALALADDLRRFRHGEPIHARPAGRAERLWRWCRRQPAVAALIVVLVAGLAGVAALWVVAQHERTAARHERDQAAHNFQLARWTVREFCLIVGKDPRLRTRSLDGLRQDMLESAVQVCEEFVRQRSDVPEVLAQQGETYALLGTIKMLLHSEAEAFELFQQAQALFDQVARARPTVPDYQNNLAALHLNLGWVYKSRGQRDQAEAAYLRARELFDQLAGGQPDVPDYRANLAGSYSNLGNLYLESNRLDQAETAFRQAVDLGEAVVQQAPDRLDFQLSLSSYYVDLAGLYKKRGRLDRTEAPYLRALALSEPLARADSGRHAIRSTLVRSLSSPTGIYRLTAQVTTDATGHLARIHLQLGDLYQKTGRQEQAEKATRRALELSEQQFRDHPTGLQSRDHLALSLDSLGQLYLHTHRLGQAEPPLRRALALRQELALEYPNQEGYQDNLAQSHEQLAWWYKSSGQREQAEAAFRQAQDIWDKLAQAQPAVLDFQKSRAANLRNLAMLYQAAGRLPQVEESYRRARDIQENLVRAYPSLPGYSAQLALTQATLGNLYQATGRPEQAEAAHRRALELWENLVRMDPRTPSYQWGKGLSLAGIGEVMLARGRPQTALQWFERSVQTVEALLESKRILARHLRPGLSESYRRLAWIFRDLGRPAEAAATSWKRGQLWPDNPIQLVQVAWELALCAPLVAKGKAQVSTAEQAERQKYLDQAREILRQALDRFRGHRLPPATGRDAGPTARPG